MRDRRHKVKPKSKAKAGIRDLGHSTSVYRCLFLGMGKKVYWLVGCIRRYGVGFTAWRQRDKR